MYKYNSLRYFVQNAIATRKMYRHDARGHEIDLIIENGPDVTLAEIKAGATISPD